MFKMILKLLRRINRILIREGNHGLTPLSIDQMEMDLREPFVLQR